MASSPYVIVDTHATKWTEKKQGETGACAHLNSKTVSAASPALPECIIWPDFVYFFFNGGNKRIVTAY